jgi:hypothetical protein
MKRIATICLIFAQLASMAADKANAELLCVWNYKTHYLTAPGNQTPARLVYSEEESFYFFSDNTYVRAGNQVAYPDVLNMKNNTPQRWLTVDNNLILLDENGKQELGIVAKKNLPVQNLLKGAKEINQVVTLKNGTVPQPYNDVLAFSPK